VAKHSNISAMRSDFRIPRLVVNTGLEPVFAHHGWGQIDPFRPGIECGFPLCDLRIEQLAM
jgi:hypothetical protein